MTLLNGTEETTLGRKNTRTMSGNHSAHTDRVSDKIDVTYEIDMLFRNQSAKINLLDHGDDVEVVVSDIPTLFGYHQNFDIQRTDNEKLKQHAVARWVLEDTARILDEYDWKSSSNKTHSGNLSLRDVYFTCARENVDDAVMDAKKFLTELEEQVLHHHRKFAHNTPELPSDILSD